MNDYIGIRNLCSLCKYGELKNKDESGEFKTKKVVCQNKNSRFYNMATTGILSAPCFSQKKLETETIVEYVGFRD